MEPLDFDLLLKRSCVLMKDYITKTSSHLNQIKSQIKSSNKATETNSNNNLFKDEREEEEEEEEEDSFETKVMQIHSSIAQSNPIKNRKVSNNDYALKINSNSKDYNSQSISIKSKTKKKKIKAQNPVIEQYKNKISKLKMTIAKLHNENACLKSQIEKEKERSREYKEITHSILLLYDNKE